MCFMDAVKVEAQDAGAFAEQMLGHINGAAITLMISLGHQSGLFDTMANLPPASSERIAAAAGLNERYVREWLGAMVTGRIVRYDAAAGEYHLPAEHAACLTRAASPNNLASVAQFVPLLGAVEEPLLDAFRRGGGVPYSRYGRFQQLMMEESNQTVCVALLDSILPLVPETVRRLQRGAEVLDVGCGAGRAMNLLARHFPKSRFAGYDLSAEGIGMARAEAEALGLTNVRFEVRDAAQLAEPGRYDLITAFDAIHDQAHPDRVLAGIARALRPDGVFLMQDIGGASAVEKNLAHPLAPFLYTISCMHCMTVSLAAGGAGLGAMWGRELAETMLADAGFSRVAVHTLPHDIQNLYFVAQR